MTTNLAKLVNLTGRSVLLRGPTGLSNLVLEGDTHAYVMRGIRGDVRPVWTAFDHFGSMEFVKVCDVATSKVVGLPSSVPEGTYLLVTSEVADHVRREALLLEEAAAHVGEDELPETRRVLRVLDRLLEVVDGEGYLVKVLPRDWQEPSTCGGVL